MNEPTHHATLQHIRLLAKKRASLERAQLAAEQQLVHAVARDFAAGEVGYADLAAIYAELKGRTLPGFATKRWRPVLPDINGIKAAVQLREAHATASADWHGTWPITDRRDQPPMGLCVVYVLFDSDLKPCYVGSTFSFGTRMGAHARSGKRWDHWQAFRCRDREHAYEVEERFLATHLPHLNKRRGR